MVRRAVVVAPALLVALAACYDVPALDGPDGGDASVASSSGASSGSTSSGGGDDEGGSSGSSSSGGHLPDAAAEATGPCNTVLCPCTSNSDCTSGICATSDVVGSDLANAPKPGFCTQTCCISSDCTDSPASVCFASGRGGNYCVNPDWLQRAAPGKKLGGAACNANTDCRSGLCTAGSLCADTCCSFPGYSVGVSQCATGAQCALGTFPGAINADRHFAAFCGTPGGSSPFGATCNSSSECAGGLCYFPPNGNCVEPCSAPSDCAGGYACLLDQEQTDIYFACFPSNASAPEGTACSQNSECLGQWCNGNKRCTNVCVSDSTCINGWHCRPQPFTWGEPPASYQILACE
jgi:hypothetical protein